MLVSALTESARHAVTVAGAMFAQRSAQVFQAIGDTEQLEGEPLNYG